MKNINFRISRENVRKLATKIKGKLGTFFDTKIGGKMIIEYWERSVENWWKKSFVLSQFINDFPSLTYKGRSATTYKWMDWLGGVRARRNCIFS